MKLFDRSTKAGFTLVELIVVIAILAILAGVAIPVYSGYIKKANKAADLVLLDAANTAFAAACLENGFNAKDVSDATLTIENKCITGVNVPTIPASFLSAGANGSGIVYGNLSAGHAAQPVLLAATSDSVDASFKKYFAGNTTVPLKYFESPDQFKFENGVFVPAEDGAGGTKTVSWTVGGQTFTMTFTQDDINKVNASTFVNDELGVDTLLDQVNAVTTLATEVLNSNSSGRGNQLLNGIISSPDFLAFAAEKLGGTLSAEQLAGAISGTLDPSTLNDEQKATLQKLTSNQSTIPNALVLYAAQQSGSLKNDSAFLSELKAMDMSGTTIDGSGASVGGDMLTLGLAAYNSIYGEGGSQDNAGSALAKAAYGYGMSIAYGNYIAQEGNSEVSWSDYLDSDQGKADFAAYASCMDMINSNASSADVTTALLSSGFGDDALAATIIEALGGNN